jgi:hypothetical protein
MHKVSKEILGWAIAGLAGLAGIAVLLAMGSVSAVGGTPMVVYKNPSCGCCTKWAEHLDEQGFDTEVRPVDNLDAVKQEAGVPASMASCHTAKVAGYFVEGHVPAADIRRLLKEKPDIAGLTVPGMPLGSPGMEVPGRSPMHYKVYAIDHQGTARIYASH